MKKLRLIIISILISITSFNVSCDFLDVQDYYDEIMPYDSVFHNTRNLQKYLWSIPTAFGDEGAFLAYPWTPGPLATDEGIAAFSAITSSWAGIGFTTGAITSDNMPSYLNTWGSMYQVVRRVNLLLSRMDEAADLTPVDRSEIVGYARFIRAYAYYRNLMNFGPLVLVGDEVLENNESPEYYNTHRATYDETIEYICNEFEEAAKLMPSTVLVTQFGRPTKGAAYGLIARLRLQHASPLYNGGAAAKRYFGSWTRSTDGVHYISQDYNEERWALAAAAAKRVIDMGMYEIYTVKRDGDTPSFPENISQEPFPDGVGEIDPFKSYSDLFTGEAVAERVKEFIWADYSPNLRDRTKNCMARSLHGGSNGLSVTQKVVNAYRMIDGRDISDSSPEYPYNPDIMNEGEAKSFSGYYLPKNISGMYVNREMRFYASVGFSGRYWTCTSSIDNSVRNQIVTYDISGNSGYNDAGNKTDYPITGYVITKFVHKDDAWKGTGARQMPKAYAIIRYAEILLSYVEAMNNLTKSYSITLPVGFTEEKTFDVSRNTEEMKYYFNQIRYRAGLPGLTNEEVNDPSEMQSLLQRELMVEFLFENRRYFDVRRWGIYEEVEREPITGLNLFADGLDFYKVQTVNHRYIRDRIVDRKLMFLPIPRAEINKVNNMDQNPGWN